MDGDFKGDFSRDSFNFLQPFSRVLMQQGRVQLDADWNEQTDSLLYYLRTLAMNVIGPAGGRRNSFKIDHILDGNGNPQNAADFTIGAGHYYIDGILCANDAVDKNGEPVKFIKYTDQLYFQDLSELTQGKARNFLAYLDAWERQVTALENYDIREVALGPGGPDTATRGEIVWQVRVISLDTVEQAIKDFHFDDEQNIINGLNQGSPMTIDELQEVKTALTEHFQSKSRGRLIASTDDNPDPLPDPCTVSPDAKFRGEENQLYRVEIHTGGTPVPASTTDASTQSTGTASGRGRKKSQQQGSEADGPTFKWSRENGSVVFAVLDNNISIVDGTITISLDNLGRDDSRFTLAKGDWVELLTLSSSLAQTPGQMLQVSKVDYTSMQVVLTFPERTVTPSIPASDTVSPFLLRRWDFHGGDPKQAGLTIASDGAAKVIENTPLNLENGIRITFERTLSSTDVTDHPTAYRTGDYWLIPARTATGAIQWPGDKKEPLPLLPKGIAHHYAPLALVTLTDGGTIEAGSGITDLRSTFEWLTELSHGRGT